MGERHDGHGQRCRKGGVSEEQRRGRSGRTRVRSCDDTEGYGTARVVPLFVDWDAIGAGLIRWRAGGRLGDDKRLGGGEDLERGE